MKRNIEDITTIWITKKTRTQLRKLGQKDQTYDQIIQKLIDGKQK